MQRYRRRHKSGFSLALAAICLAGSAAISAPASAKEATGPLVAKPGSPAARAPRIAESRPRLPPPTNLLYLAEGTVRPGFVEYVVIQNTEQVPNDVTLSFFAANDAGTAVPVPDKLFTMPPLSRTTVNVNAHLATNSVPTPINISTVIGSTGVVNAERPMYFKADPGLGIVVDGGTNAVADPFGLSTTYNFAEGTVRPGFVEYLTIQNPNVTGTAAISFNATDDQGVAVPIPPTSLPLPANSRVTFILNQYLASLSLTAPLNISTFISADVDVMAERPMYFHADPGLGSVVKGGTSIVGSACTCPTSVFPEGTVRPGWIEYLTIQNPNPVTGTADIAFLLTYDDGITTTIPDASVTLPPDSRTTFNVNQYLAANAITQAVNVASVVAADLPIAAERPMYFDADPGLGSKIRGGTVDADPAGIFVTQDFAEGTVRPGFVQYLTFLEMIGFDGTLTISFEATDDLGNPVLITPALVPLPASSRVTFNVNQYLASQGVTQPVNLSIHVDSDTLFNGERPIYFNADPGLGSVVNDGTVAYGV